MNFIHNCVTEIDFTWVFLFSGIHKHLTKDAEACLYNLMHNHKIAQWGLVVTQVPFSYQTDNSDVYNRREQH